MDTFGTQRWSARNQFQGWMGLHSQQPDQSGSAPYYWARVTAQSGSHIRSQHSLHDRDLEKMTTSKPHVTARLSPRQKLTSLGANHVQLRRKGIGWQNIAESRSRVSMTRSIDSTSLIAWGRIPHKKTTTSRVPNLERPIIWSRNRIILANF